MHDFSTKQINTSSITKHYSELDQQYSINNAPESTVCCMDYMLMLLDCTEI